MGQTGKGVICKIVEPWEMPVDENGVRADIILDPNATFSRMNLSRLFETYINSASRDLTIRLRKMFELTGEEIDLFRQIEKKDKGLVNQAWNILMEYYGIISPRQKQWMTDGTYTGTKEEHLFHVLRDGIYLHIPTDNEPEYMQYITEIEEKFRPTYGYIYWTDKNGNKVQSKEKVRISTLYMMLLEKTGNDWAATSSGKLQQHGILAPLSAIDKHSSPARQQPTRAHGEAEVRSFVSYVDPRTTADVLDRNNNPEVHKQIVRNILSAPQPTNIEEIVDREKYPLGYSKVLQIVKHMAQCHGYKFSYKDVDKLSYRLKTNRPTKTEDKK